MTGVQTCALPIWCPAYRRQGHKLVVGGGVEPPQRTNLVLRVYKAQRHIPCYRQLKLLTEELRKNRLIQAVLKLVLCVRRCQTCEKQNKQDACYLQSNHRSSVNLVANKRIELFRSGCKPDAYDQFASRLKLFLKPFSDFVKQQRGSVNNQQWEHRESLHLAPNLVGRPRLELGHWA